MKTRKTGIIIAAVVLILAFVGWTIYTVVDNRVTQADIDKFNDTEDTAVTGFYSAVCTAHAEVNDSGDRLRNLSRTVETDDSTSEITEKIVSGLAQQRAGVSNAIEHLQGTEAPTQVKYLGQGIQDKDFTVPLDDLVNVYASAEDVFSTLEEEYSSVQSRQELSDVRESTQPEIDNVFEKLSTQVSKAFENAPINSEKTREIIRHDTPCAELMGAGEWSQDDRNMNADKVLIRWVTMLNEVYSSLDDGLMGLAESTDEDMNVEEAKSAFTPRIESVLESLDAAVTRVDDYPSVTIGYPQTEDTVSLDNRMTELSDFLENYRDQFQSTQEALSQSQAPGQVTAVLTELQDLVDEYNSQRFTVFRDVSDVEVPTEATVGELQNICDKQWCLF